VDEIDSVTSARQSRAGDSKTGAIASTTGTSAIAPDEANIEPAAAESRR
jgi:hypothetical protein